MKTSLKYSLYFGIASLIILLLRYFVDKNMLFDIIPTSVIGYLLPLVFMVLACLAYRKSNDGYLEFGEGIRTAWVTFAIGSFLSVLCIYVLFNFVDPSLKEFAKVKMEENMKSQAEWMNSSSRTAEAELKKEELENSTAKIMELFGDPYRFSFQMINYVTQLLIPGIVYAIIIALIFRRKRT